MTSLYIEDPEKLYCAKHAINHLLQENKKVIGKLNDPMFILNEPSEDKPDLQININAVCKSYIRPGEHIQNMR